MAQFGFSIEDNRGVLDYLARQTSRDGPADVLRDALSLYEYLLRQRLDGEKIFLGRDKDGARELAVTTFEIARINQ